MMIFDKMEKFASYGFNKSHAAAYGYLSYVTAYLKANYPREWMAALMTCDRDDLTKVAKFIRECQSMDIPILPPDVNEAGAAFQATKQGIRFAMSGIKGVGAGVVEAIIAGTQAEEALLKVFMNFLSASIRKKWAKKPLKTWLKLAVLTLQAGLRDALINEHRSHL